MDYVVDTPRIYCAPKIDPADEVDEKWVTRSAYKFVDIDWFVEACIAYPRAAIEYGLRRNKPHFIPCFYPRDISFRDDDDE